jgi:hypothetical protein
LPTVNIPVSLYRVRGGMTYDAAEQIWSMLKATYGRDAAAPEI